MTVFTTPEQWGVAQWMVAAFAAFLIGASKAGFGGVSTLFVLLMATIMEARASTGFILPLLLLGDIFAVATFRRYADWKFVRRLLPPAMVGVYFTYRFMDYLARRHPDDNHRYKVIIGGIVLVLCILQIVRMIRENWFTRFPDSRLFSMSMGGICGFSTMLANNSGPIANWYFLASGLPKMELVGTAAWFFLLLNTWKIPFSYALGLINIQSLHYGLFLAPAVPAGVYGGRWLLGRISQKTFEILMLTLSFAAALRLIFS